METFIQELLSEAPHRVAIGVVTVILVLIWMVNGPKYTRLIVPSITPRTNNRVKVAGSVVLLAFGGYLISIAPNRQAKAALRVNPSFFTMTSPTTNDRSVVSQFTVTNESKTEVARNFEFYTTALDPVVTSREDWPGFERKVAAEMASKLRRRIAAAPAGETDIGPGATWPETPKPSIIPESLYQSLSRGLSRVIILTNASWTDSNGRFETLGCYIFDGNDVPPMKCNVHNQEARPIKDLKKRR